MKDFPLDTKRSEYLSANKECRICNAPCDNEDYCTSIYNYARNGVNEKLWNDINFMSSIHNCILLCNDCYLEVNSPNGVYNYTVSDMFLYKNIHYNEDLYLDLYINSPYPKYITISLLLIVLSVWLWSF